MSETPIRRSSRATAAAHPYWELETDAQGGTLAPREELPAADADYVETPRRAVAFVLDVLFVQVTATMTLQVLAFIAGMTVLKTLPGGVQDQVLQAWLGFLLPTLLVGLLQAIVHVYFWRVWRQTPAQHILGIYTVRAADGRRLSKRRATLRWLVTFMPAWLIAGSSNVAIWWAYAIFKGTTADQGTTQTTVNGLSITLPIVWWGILLISTLVARNGRGLHDRLSGAVVVQPR
jgi:hypothetical protein